MLYGSLYYVVGVLAGPGCHAVALARRGVEVVALDNEEAMVAYGVCRTSIHLNTRFIPQGVVRTNVNIHALRHRGGIGLRACDRGAVQHARGYCKCTHLSRPPQTDAAVQASSHPDYALQ